MKGAIDQHPSFLVNLLIICKYSFFFGIFVRLIGNPLNSYALFREIQ